MKKLLILGLQILSVLATAATFKPNDRIISTSGDTGRIIDFLADGRARISYDGWTPFYYEKLSDLSLAVVSIKGFTFGTRVIDEKDQPGKVIEVFENGKVQIDFDRTDYREIRKTNSLSKSVRCVGSLCVEDRFRDSKKFEGKVVEVFANGKARVLYDGYESYYIRDYKSLGIQLNCMPTLTCPVIN